MSQKTANSRLLRRRQFIQRLAATGALGSAGLTGFIGRALAKGDLPGIPGVNRLEGRATVNGKEATVGTPVVPGDRVSTGAGSQAVIVIRDDAFLVRENTTLEFAESGGVLSRILIEAGAVLSVFGKKPLQIKAATATIGIRGTGVYMEADPEQTYFCTCYGVADIASNADPQSQETVAAQHHDRPLYIVKGEPAGRNIREAPFINHTDQELMMIESLVGRQPPFVFPKSDYTGPRRNY